MTIKEVTCGLVDPNQGEVYQGQEVDLRAQITNEKGTLITKEEDLVKFNYEWTAAFGSYSAAIAPKNPNRRWEATLKTAGVELGIYTVTVKVVGDANSKEGTKTVTVNPAAVSDFSVRLGRSSIGQTPIDGLWPAIRQSTDALLFTEYSKFIDTVMCGGPNALPDENERKRLNKLTLRRGTPFPGVDAYQLLKVATEVFVMLNCGVLDKYEFSAEDAESFDSRNERNLSAGQLTQRFRSSLESVNGAFAGNGNLRSVKTLPYLALIRRKLRDVPIVYSNSEEEQDTQACVGILERKLSQPCFFELIWSYWHEEAMLVQTLNAISIRFQNQRLSKRDPLAAMDIDPLRPLGNLLWGYIQDEQHRLSVVRRAYEYDHHYGMTLRGKALPQLRPADSRSKFLEAFHNLLHTALLFYKQDDDTTMKPDGFPVLNALREVHLVLTEGMHNQFGDLPSTARIEMLMQQWILARPEMREFIGGRIMVPYTEGWMDRVDAMKKIQGWTDVSVTFFNDLARFGEQVLLSIRYGAWNTVHDASAAVNWARDWRAEVKQYVHAYRVATGVDLSPVLSDVRLASDRYIQPSVHLERRLEIQHGRQAEPLEISSSTTAGAIFGRDGTTPSQVQTGNWRARRVSRQTTPIPTEQEIE